MKRRLYIAAVNNRYGNNAFLPYAAGLIWGYARQFPEITDAYELGGMLYLKEPIEQTLARMEAPDVLALSSYIWNHEWNKALARGVKEKWPGCAIVVGGVQVADKSPAVLQECEAFDFAIYGEGEGAFADFLRTHAYDHRGGLMADYPSVGSLIWRSEMAPWNDFAIHGKYRIIVNPRHAETPLDTIPSPYLDGLFDHIIAERPDLKFQALQETNRGCPYTCSFCAWGASTLSKLRQFPRDRVVAEFEWMANHRIEFLYNADANWGILPRDVDLTEELVNCKAVTGYPQKFRAAFAKNSNEVVFGISKQLHDAGMLKATTLALQSMDEKVLVNIQRKNIKYDKLAELTKRYEDAGISTYAEVIVGLAGETYESYIAGIDRLIEAGQHDGISIYLCMLLENTEMNTPAYREAHGIESVAMKALLYHGTPEPGVVEEIQETVIGTAAMPRVWLRQSVLYGWLIQACHAFGFTQHLARRLHAEHDVKYSRFYGALLDWFTMHANSKTVLGVEMARVAALWDDAVSGATWDTVDPLFGEVSWPPEELLFLRLACQSERFYDEVTSFLHGLIEPWKTEGLKVIDEQRALFIPPEPGNEEEYAREAVWFGRKGRGAKLRLRASVAPSGA